MRSPALCRGSCHWPSRKLPLATDRNGSSLPVRGDPPIRPAKFGNLDRNGGFTENNQAKIGQERAFSRSNCPP